MTSLYKTPVTNLNGIGEKRAALFARLGIKSVGDLINFLSTHIRGLEQHQAY